jgi:lysophospholipid acyltransferase (LPLAT)-like uncharacterized protein
MTIQWESSEVFEGKPRSDEAYNRRVARTDQSEQEEVSVAEASSVEAETIRRFSLRQRLAIWAISGLGTLVIRLIGPTLRVTFEIEEGGAPDGAIFPGVYCFWHECIFSAAYIHRNRPISVMASRSFDGEYIARMIENMGFRAVRGSSSRGGARALLEMHHEVEEDRIAAFTIDGPRGPRHVAKPGPVLLARNTQAPLVCFHVAHKNAWVLGTWDRMQVPKPFSRAHVAYGRMVRIPKDADAASMERFHAAMQAGLERVREMAEEKFSAGS